MKIAAFLALLSSVALGDVVFKNAGVTKGPVTSINCAPDAGLSCSRDAGSVGTISCNAATPTEPGCINPSAQTFAGPKSFNDYVRLVGVAHASLVACDMAHQNMEQGCTTHGALVWCNGTTNIENGGSGGSSVEGVIDSVYVNGIPIGLAMTPVTLNGLGATVTAIQSSWVAGSTTDGGVLTITVTDGSNLCTCAASCSAPATRTACTGNCTYAAGVSITPARVPTSSCTKDPVIPGNMLIMGTRQ